MALPDVALAADDNFLVGGASSSCLPSKDFRLPFLGVSAFFKWLYRALVADSVRLILAATCCHFASPFNPWPTASFTASFKAASSSGVQCVRFCCVAACA
eukprot:TRINITY_DN5065_c0_g1_i1.p1 TRINITY_DN5065_c0_g1~~TRINITY_DN5065_c0_g1_i1.p1  ORF type:complete len:100 (-),score=8.35 TRINITY_DN5065_c0_g1_i1:318-617(-)